MAIDMDEQAQALRQILTDRGLTHLRVTRRGKALTLVEDQTGDPEARLTLVGPGMWRLDLRHHSGRWDQTPIVGDIAEMVDVAASMGRLEDFGPSGPWNSGDT